MNSDKIISAWIEYCRSVLPDEWTITRAEEVTGKDAPRPVGPYLTLKIISGPGKLSIDDELRFNGKESGERNFNLVGQRAYTLSIKAFRSGHGDALEELSACIEEPDLYSMLRERADISVTRRGPVIDISGMLDTGFEGRSSLDIFFNSSNNKETSVGIIESVQVEGKIKTEDGNEVNTNMPPITKE